MLRTHAAIKRLGSTQEEGAAPPSRGKTHACTSAPNEIPPPSPTCNSGYWLTSRELDSYLCKIDARLKERLRMDLRRRGGRSPASGLAADKRRSSPGKGYTASTAVPGGGWQTTFEHVCLALRRTAAIRTGRWLGVAPAFTLELSKLTRSAATVTLRPRRRNDPLPLPLTALIFAPRTPDDRAVCWLGTTMPDAAEANH